MLTYILIIWLLGTGDPPVLTKVATYETKALCEEAAQGWHTDRWSGAKCLPIESRSSVIESTR